MMALQQAKEMLNAEIHGENVTFSNVSTDTRSLQSGDLYIALHGENFDGHDYIVNAQEAGAVAAIVHKDVATALPYLKVEDTRKALGQLASAWRQRFKGKVIGVTGSNGKTTVKEMIAVILSKQGDVMATAGNFNNDIGLPLTLLRMQNESFAVIEMGANHPGEISNLTSITKPDVAIITNAGSAHLDGFGSIKGVATAKAEIYEGLDTDGIAIVNKDDEYSEFWASLCSANKTLSFSMLDRTATVFGAWRQTISGGEIVVEIAKTDKLKEKMNITLNVHGVHNAMNALAAITVAVALNIDHEKIKQALEEFKAVKGRLNIHQVGKNLIVIDDTYNANPASLNAGVDVLNEMPGKHWLVLGDMGELGGDEGRLHFDAGMKARSSGVDRLLCIGRASKHAVDAFGENAQFFNNKDELVSHIKQHNTEELAILIKGSRFMHMEQIVESLIKESN